jgi:hypothetical protein
MLRGAGRIQKYAAVTTANYIAPNLSALINAKYLVIGGGGGGGSDIGGGGGAGGYVEGTTILNNVGGGYVITVGGGGPVQSSGASSSIGSLVIALGGGRGGDAPSDNAATGGSGGGGAGSYYGFKTGKSSIQNSTYGYGVGNSGGDSSSSGGQGSSGAGGGGGAGGNGTTGVPGNGGSGLSSSISGSNITYAAGGGGGTLGLTPGSGVSGVSGNGGNNSPGSAAPSNRGGGGGGGGGGSQPGAAGGSGIVIISYSGALKFTGGDVTGGSNALSISSGSVYFSGASYMRVPTYSSIFDLSGGDWTIECWFNANVLSGNLIAKDTYGSNYDWSIGMSPSSLNCYTSGTASSLIATVPTMTTGTWYHVALVRRLGTNIFYLNGVAYGNNTMGFTNASTGSGPTIGASGWNNPNSYFNGYISNLRLVKGVAVYTGNFTVPISPLTIGQSAGTNIAALTTGTETSLLLSTTQAAPFADSSSYSNTISNVGGLSVVSQPNFYTVATTTTHIFTSSGSLVPISS